jgi:beta-galactosidase
MGFSQAKRELPFNDNWLFLKDSAVNAVSVNYADSKWRQLDLPHDWSIEDLPNQKADSVIGPFHRKSVSQGATGHTVGGIGWYRKKFVTEKSFQNQIVSIHFDGVYMNSDVWLNGQHLGNHRYGYTPFYYDLTRYLNPPGKENVLVVRVKNEGKNSRWYSGSGIYRSVWLTVTDRLHIAPWGTQVSTKEVRDGRALIEVSTDLKNGTNRLQEVTVNNIIVSPEGTTVSRRTESARIDQGLIEKNTQQLYVEHPELWSVETPKLYKLITEVRQGKKVIDQNEIYFGIRTISVSAESGFVLNGVKVLLKGGCIHHDNGPLGAAVYYRAEERKIEILKRNGFNAVRTSHNPPSRELLEACDRLGMLVIDEAFDMWELPKNPQDYHLYFKGSWQKDIDAMVLRDRNHPSVILWSIGNEIKERVDSSGLRITKALAERVHLLDPSRPVTEALCSFWDNPGYKWESTEAAFSMLDVGGYNYLMTEYEKDHQNFPSRVMLGTESFPRQALENWNLVEKHPYLLGDFVWTAFDYIGEAAIGNATYDTIPKLNMSLAWPWFNAFCGDIDLIGNKKPQSHYRDVVWRNKPIAMVVHAPAPEGMVENVSFWGWPDEMASWTWPQAAGKKLQVRVFSRAPLVKLFLNDKFIGEKKIVTDSITAVFDVPYAPGKLKAVNITDGKKSDSIEFKTAGAAKSIRLTVDRKIIDPKDDLAYVMAEVIDEAGEVVPHASTPIRFSVEGVGTIAAVANASPTEMASFQSQQCKTWRGRCLAIIRSADAKGAIKLKANSDGLIPGEVEIEVR